MQKTQAQNTVCPAQIRIGTRASHLALIQAAEVKNRLLGAFSQLTQEQVDIIKITTTGDRQQEKNLAEIGGKGLFTKEIEEALYDQHIDIAVHSMKDMPDRLPDGMVIDCVLERQDPHDAFISHKAKSLEDLPPNAMVGTSSVRRQSQLLLKRPDVKVVPFRGNVLTRLDKLERGDVEATFLAVAGLKRMDMDDIITSVVDTEVMIPAVAQGAIGVECLSNNTHILEVLHHINHEESFIRISCERAFLQAIGGSCTTPIGALAEVFGDNQLRLRARIAAPDGSIKYDTLRVGSLDDAIVMGADAGQELKAKGAHILEWKN